MNPPSESELEPAGQVALDLTEPTYSIREQRGWYFYDWANSVFATSSIALFLPTYVPALAAAAADPDGYVYPLGIPISAPSFWVYVVGLSVALQVLVLPVIGAIADYGRRKRECLAVTAFLGSCAAMAMFFLDGTDYMLAGGLFLFGNVSFGASIVVYNSFLPEIAAPQDRDRISSRAWALGFLAGALMLLVHLGLVTGAESFGITEAMAVRICLGSAGLWWLVFTIPTLRVLKNRGVPKPLPDGTSIWTVGFGQLFRTIRDIRRFPETARFLIAYLFYNDAMQTVFVVAAQFGSQELGLEVSQLVWAILIAQVVGIFGALGLHQVSKRIGVKKAIAASLIVWTLILLYAYGFVYSLWDYLAMAAAAGTVMGGSQALSRSLFAQLVPRGKEAEYFSLYEIGDKGTSWMGPPLFGITLQLTGSYRIALLSLATFFLVGLVVLLPLHVETGRKRIIADSLVNQKRSS